jgi:SAM-dependent methyltransferase
VTENIEFYERFAPYYESVYGHMDPASSVRECLGLLGRVAPDLSRRLGSDAPPRLLDVGCGPGLHLGPWRDAGFVVAGLDASPTMLRLAATAYRRYMAGRRTTDNDQCTLYLADVRDKQGLQAMSSLFDVAVARFNFLNLFRAADIAIVMASLAQLVRADGMLVTDFSEESNVPIDLQNAAVTNLSNEKVPGTLETVERDHCQEWLGVSEPLHETYWSHSGEEVRHAGNQAGWTEVAEERTVSETGWGGAKADHVVKCFRRR